MAPSFLDTGAAHSNVYRLLKKLRDEEALIKLEVRQYQAGDEAAPQQRRRYREANERIGNIVAGYNNGTNLVPYLRAIAHNLSY
jgi:hypothetical protein